MPQPALFNFTLQKEARTITVERSFNAPLDPVWAAFTEADILCQWWAPKPYACVIQSLDFREGGRWLYCMEGPQGDRHHCFFDYETVRPKTYYMGHDGFCDEQGKPTDMIPSTKWENRFSEENGTTVVRMLLIFESEEALAKMIEMGFKEGFTMGLDQLDQLFTEQKFYHGTKADLKAGDLIEPGNHSNYGQQKKARFVYLTATLDAATWGAELAQGEGRGRVYIVEPTGHYENDPNLTDKRFKGNPTKSYRTKAALRVVGEVKDWQGHAPEQLQAMKDHLQRLKEQGIEAIED
ncbi:MAG: NAD(+)--rifampin ADP-ribosyltransferase [Flavobacteriales bacterium]|nr:NAD(+)--rifampin ADP-ribosyltransferase [Flavobacteriales bacterium]